MGDVQGFVRDDLAGVRDVFAQSFADGAEVGASYCATVGGETVVDVYGGHADAARSRA